MTDQPIDFDGLAKGLAHDAESVELARYWLRRVLAAFGDVTGDPWRDTEACRCAMMICQILQARHEGSTMIAATHYLSATVGSIALISPKILPKEDIMPRVTWSPETTGHFLDDFRHARGERMTTTRAWRWLQIKHGLAVIAAALSPKGGHHADD